jgi:iron complex transport system permease protein
MTVQDHSTKLNFALLIALGFAIMASCLLGATVISWDAVFAALIGVGDTQTSVIVWSIRLPRAIAALAVGIALGASGAALQGLLRNPLAEPGVLGVSGCASLLATIVIYWGIVDVSPWILPGASITGALVATGLLAFLAPRIGSIVTLILVGVGLSSFSGALMSLMLNLAPNPFSLSDMVNWMMGSVANRSFDDLAFAAPFFVLGLMLLWFSGSGLRALALGEEAANAVGLDVGKSRTLVVLGTGLMTGAAVSIAGAVGFVGMIAPHLVRPLVGYDPARALVPSALLGGLILVLADILARLAPTDQELKLGVVAALIGAPVFVYIAATRRALGETS